MPVDILRLIDFWIGLPLCVVLTPVALVMRLFKSEKRSSESVKKILIIKLSELGAIVLAYPCLTTLKAQYPQADIHVLTFARNRELVVLLDDVIKPEHIITVDDHSPTDMLKAFLSLIPRLWNEKFDVVVDLEFFSRIGALLSFLTFAPTSVGFYRYGFEGLYRGNFQTHRVMYNPLAHVSVNYAALAQALRDPYKQSPELKFNLVESQLRFPQYQHRPSVKDSLTKFHLPSDKKIFLMNVGEGVLSLREWPIENFVEVARFILKDPGNVVVLVGTQSAQQKAKQVQAMLNHANVIDISGQTTLIELMEIFLRSKALIANDCGLVHLAMMTDIQKFVFFGPESPQIFGPIGKNTHIFYSRWPCSPCLSILNHRHSSCQDNLCLKAIQPGDVIAKIQHV